MINLAKKYEMTKNDRSFDHAVDDSFLIFQGVLQIVLICSGDDE